MKQFTLLALFVLGSVLVGCSGGAEDSGAASGVAPAAPATAPAADAGAPGAPKLDGAAPAMATDANGAPL